MPIQVIDFSKEDEENPRNWPRARKFLNVGIIAFMAGKSLRSAQIGLRIKTPTEYPNPVLSPLASSMFTPGIAEIAEDLKTTESVVVGATTGFVVFLGLGPLVLAPLSETFGRRKLYLVCFTLFALLQIPTALSPNVGTLIGIRTISGFFGSMSLRHTLLLWCFERLQPDFS
jgi:MFS family permease